MFLQNRESFTFINAWINACINFKSVEELQIPSIRSKQFLTPAVFKILRARVVI